MDWLKTILENENFTKDQLKEAIQKEIPKYFMPKDKYNEASESLKELKGQLADRDKQLKDLGEKAKGNEDLQKQIADLQEVNKKTSGDYEAKIKNMTLDNAIKMLLKDNKAKYEDLLMSKFDREKLSIKEDGTIEGLNEQLGTIKEGYKDLFEQQLKGTPPITTGGSAPKVNPLQTQLDEAKKAGNTALVVSLNRQLFEQQQNNNNNI